MESNPINMAVQADKAPSVIKSQAQNERVELLEINEVYFSKCQAQDQIRSGESKTLEPVVFHSENKNF